MIIGAAFLEGPAFANFVGYMTEPHIVSAIVGVLLILAVLAEFPTVGRVESWLEQQLRLLQEERELKSAEY